MPRVYHSTLNAQSVVAEIPAHRVVLEWDALGEVLGELFRGDSRLPGVILSEYGKVRGAVSRTQYFSAIGRFLGIELYHTRPVSVLYGTLTADARLMVLPGHCPIHEALRRCLERPDSTVYEPVLVSYDADGADIRMVDFLDLLMANSQVSALRNRQMEEILKTVSDGLLMMDEHFTIQGEYSRALEQILETPRLEGRSLLDVLGESLPAATCMKAADYFGTLFNEKVIERLIIKINPIAQARAAFSSPRGEITKFLKFSFMRSLREGRIHRVLVRVEDVTRATMLAEELKSQSRRAEERMELGFQLVRAESQLLADFLASLERELTRAEEVFAAGAVLANLGPARDRLYRIVHGFKGEAGLLQLTSFARRLHALEDELEQKQELADTGGLRKGLESVRELLTESYGVIQQFRALARIHPRHADESGAAEEARPTGVLPLAEALLREQAQRRGLQARFHSHVTDGDLPAAYRSLIKDCLVQFIRNSVGHGIESPEERLAHGKPAEATVQFIIRPQADHRQWELIYQDDGRGLDLGRIQQRLQELGWAWSNEEDLRQAIFLPGFSTAATTDDLAGRGVGMDLVKTLVDAVGGFIQVHSAAGVYCAFQIVLPVELAPATGSSTATRELATV